MYAGMYCPVGEVYISRIWAGGGHSRIISHGRIETTVKSQESVKNFVDLLSFKKILRNN